MNMLKQAGMTGAALTASVLAALPAWAQDAALQAPEAAAEVVATVNKGDGGLDHSGLFKLVEELSGRSGR